MLEGREINLRIAEKDDVALVSKWWNDRDYSGQYQPPMTVSEETLEKDLFKHSVFLIVEKKNQTKIGHINGWTRGSGMEIGYALIPCERGKGYGTEAIKIMVDHLFLSRDIVRIQAPTETRNMASVEALEKAGFTREGIMRKASYVDGEHRDQYLYSILREEWKEPRILGKVTTTTS